MAGLKVALLANLKKNAPHAEGEVPDNWADLDAETTTDAIAAAIRAGGHECVFREGCPELYDQLRNDRPDICFNICEGHFGDGREAQVPALLEMLRLPYTGSRVLSLALALDKPLTKRVLVWHDLPTPAFQTFEAADEPLDNDMSFPLFVKPSREGTGMGVSVKSIVHSEPELREQLDFIINHYRQTALVERFIAGREVTVGVVGNISRPASRRLPTRFYNSARRDYSEAGLAALKAGGMTFMPPMEVNLAPYIESDGVYSNRLKTDLADQLDYLCPAPLAGPQVRELNWLTAAVFRVIGCNDVSRVDFRLDESDNLKPYILEVNPLPGLAPGISDLVIEAAAVGMSHTELVNMILETAIIRHGLKTHQTVSLPQ
jgi:D-alanine-D-alanine ligase